MIGVNFIPIVRVAIIIVVVNLGALNFLAHLTIVIIKAFINYLVAIISGTIIKAVIISETIIKVAIIHGALKMRTINLINLYYFVEVFEALIFLILNFKVIQ